MRKVQGTLQSAARSMGNSLLASDHVSSDFPQRNVGTSKYVSFVALFRTTAKAEGILNFFGPNCTSSKFLFVQIDDNNRLAKL